MAGIQDSSGIPASSGFRKDPVKITDGDIEKERKRKQYLYVSAVVQRVLDEHPALNELRTRAARQQVELDKARQLTQQMQGQIEALTEQNQELQRQTEQYRQWEEQIHEHVASVDAKALSIEELKALTYAMYDICMQLMGPELKKAEMLIRAYKHLQKQGPKLRSRVDGEDIGPVVRPKRWYEQGDT